MAKKNVLEFIRTHKKEIAIVAGTAIAGGIVFVIAKKKPTVSSNTVNSLIEKWRDVDHSAITIGRISECNTNGEWIDVIVNDIKVSDLAAFSEELQKLEGVNSDTGVSAMISLSNNW